jgi:hypothetical protein
MNWNSADVWIRGEKGIETSAKEFDVVFGSIS